MRKRRMDARRGLAYLGASPLGGESKIKGLGGRLSQAEHKCDDGESREGVRGGGKEIKYFMPGKPRAVARKRRNKGKKE